MRPGKNIGMGNIQMKTFDFLWDSSVRRNLEKKETAELAASAKSVLIQLFTPEKDPAKIRTMLSVLREYFPTASIIGGSTPGVVAGNSLVSDYDLKSRSFIPMPGHPPPSVHRVCAVSP